MLFSRILSRFSFNATIAARSPIAGVEPRSKHTSTGLNSSHSPSQTKLKSKDAHRQPQQLSPSSSPTMKVSPKKVQHVSANTVTPAAAIEASLSSVKSVYDFARLSGELKKLRRQGWTQFVGITQVESVADHSWRMGLLCMLLSKDGSIDVAKCMKFSLIHDLSEVVAGDITPHDGVTEAQKQVLEEDGMMKLLSVIGDETMRGDIYGLWREYEDRTCVEAKLVKDLDRYEMLLQAFEYEQQYAVDLTEFFANNAHKITQPIVKQWLADLQERRVEYNVNKKINTKTNEMNTLNL